MPLPEAWWESEQCECPLTMGWHELPLEPSDWLFRKCLLNHSVSAAAATKLAGSDMERQDQKTEPKDISQ